MRNLAILLLCFSLVMWARADEEQDQQSGMRIEVEEKLLVPQDKADELWRFMKRRFVDDKTYLQSLDPELTSYWNDEEFWDTYFDDPELRLLAGGNGVRHRRRINHTNPDDRKNNRELMQIKVNSIDPSNKLARGEYKYEIDRPRHVKTRDDAHPMLGLVKDREALKSQLTALGLDPYAMRPILVVHDLRSRIYILKAGKPFLSISLDRVDSSMWWATTRFTEVEPENNEIAYTQASPKVREFLNRINRILVEEIGRACPSAREDLTPKYSKSFQRLEAQLPFLRTLVRYGLNNQDALILLLAVGVGGLVLGIALRIRRRVRR